MSKIELIRNDAHADYLFQYVTAIFMFKIATTDTRAMMRASLLGIATFDAIYDVVPLFILGAAYIGIGAMTLKLIERNLKKKALISVF